jgi:hypothetical protein
MAATTYPSINAPLLYPSVSTYSSSGSITLASGSVPTSWVLSAPVTGADGNLLQQMLNAFYEENQYLYPAIQTLKLTRGFFFDWYEPDQAWYTVYNKNFTSVGVKLSDNSTETLSPAKSDLELFYSPAWTYRTAGREVLISGLGIQTQTTESRGTDWQFLSNPAKYDNDKYTYWQHPVSKGWIPFIPGNIRSDGLTGIKYPSSINIRSFNKAAQDSLTSVDVIFDEDTVTAQRVNLWTSVDEKGLLWGLKRGSTENSRHFADKLLATSWFARTQSTRATQNAIATGVGEYTVTSVSRTATGCTAPAGYTFHSVKEVLPVRTVWEEALTPTGSGTFYSIYAEPIRGTAFVGAAAYEATNNNGLVTILNYTHTNEIVDVLWMLEYWTDSETGVSFGSSLPAEGGDLTVLSTRKTQVVNNNLEARIENFQTWPGLKWQLNDQIRYLGAGLATFE